MPTAYATHLTQFGGERMGKYRFAQVIPLAIAGTIKAGKISAMQKWQPWEQARAKTVLALHPLAIWDNLTLTITSGQGIFGRAITLHYGWAHEGEAAPTTASDFAQLFGYSVHTIGGSADPGSFRVQIEAPFNESRSDVLKAANFPVGERIIFYHMFTEADFGSTQVDGDRFLIVASGEYTTYGQL